MSNRGAVGRLGRGSIMALAALGSAGCGAPEETTGEADQAALSANALSANALSANAMDPAAMSAAQDPGTRGDLARAFLRYAVSCAFRADQRLDLTWTGADGTVHAESYPGQLGLAPSWATGSLGSPGRQWVSACLAARVNAFGVTVPLSLRGPTPALATSCAEAAAFPTREGAFFGDLFSGTPKVYACYDPTTTVLSDLRHRVCAQPTSGGTGHECGPIQVLGPCVQLLGLLSIGPCSAQDPQLRYFSDCSSSGGTSIPAITSFLEGPL